MPLRSTVLSQNSRQIPTANLPEDARVRGALDWFKANEGWIEEQQIRLTEIPAPSFHEEKRAEAVKALLEAEGLDDAQRQAGQRDWGIEGRE